MNATAWTLLFALTALMILPDVLWRCLGLEVDNWISALVLPLLFLAVLFGVCGSRPWLACLMLIPFAAIAPVEAIYIVEFGRPTSDAILATILVTNLSEAREFLGNALMPILLAMVAGLLLSVAAVFQVYKSKLRLPRPIFWTLPAALLAAWLILSEASAAKQNDVVTGARVPITMSQAVASTVSVGYPFGFAVRITQFVDQWRQIGLVSDRLATFRFEAVKSASIRQRRIYILVIGESSRRENWQMFGYERATNPALTHLSNLVPIPDMVTSWPLSVQAIPQLLTRRPISDSESFWPEASIVSLAREAGYETHWLSNQRPIGASDSTVSIYAHEAQHLRFVKLVPQTLGGGYDGDLLRPLQDVISSSNADEFIVLHLMGSHLTYDFRYPEEFKLFRPTTADRGSNPDWREDMRNSYDNSILYTDFVLSKVIQSLQGSGAMTALWYESDHGERLPKTGCDMPGHGRGSRYEFPISAFFWYSDAFASAYPGRIASMRRNAPRRTLSADTFESLADLLDAMFPGHDTTHSLFSENWAYRQRIVHTTKQVDFDHSAIAGPCEIMQTAEKPSS